MSTVIVAVDAADGETGQKVVTTAGTPVKVTTSTRKMSIGARVRALAANTGKIYVGFSNAVSSSTGYQLSAGESVLVEVRTADGLWIDSSVNAEGVCFMLV